MKIVIIGDNPQRPYEEFTYDPEEDVWKDSAGESVPSRSDLNSCLCDLIGVLRTEAAYDSEVDELAWR